jgi:alkylhydroperoxidase family enzyme
MPTAEPLDARTPPIREGLARELNRAWARLAAPGTWWDAAERLAIAAEVRAAPACALCAQRKQALSPYTVGGAHDHAGALPEAVVEVVHRLATDAGRLKRSWVEAMCSSGVTEEQYVEIVGVVALVTALDSFDRALGADLRPLPAPQPGTPSCRRPSGATRDLAWVATVAPQALTPGDPNPYAVHGDKNIHRALSLVPQEVFNFFDLDVELYLKDSEIRDFETEYRALSHAQIELVAGRVSALNGCYY